MTKRIGSREKVQTIVDHEHNPNCYWSEGIIPVKVTFEFRAWDLQLHRPYTGEAGSEMQWRSVFFLKYTICIFRMCDDVWLSHQLIRSLMDRLILFICAID